MKNNFVFFGTPRFATAILDELEAANLLPSLIVTAPDKPAGRGMKLTPPPVKVWADAHKIPMLQPNKLDEEFISKLRITNCELFVVAAYGKILPKPLLDIPPRGVLNVHPSLLPKLRGASPIQSAILNDDRDVGVSIMLLDEKMDHGPIVAQKKIAVLEWPIHASELEVTLAREGGKLLALVLPQWIAGEIESHEQNHDIATYCEKFSKEDGFIDLSAPVMPTGSHAYTNLLKIRAFDSTIGTYSFFERGGKKMRAQILDAHIESDALVIDSVKPEGKNTTDYKAFLASGARPSAVA